MTGTQFITTNDGVKIAFERMGRSGPVVVLLHGQYCVKIWALIGRAIFSRTLV